MKSVVIIAIVAVAMIGVISPSVFAEDTQITIIESNILNMGNIPISVATVGDALFVGVDVENFGSNSEEFTISYRYSVSSQDNWSEWTWVSSILNEGKASSIAIPWNPTKADSYELEIQVWDNVLDRTTIDTEKINFTVKSSPTETSEPKEPSFVNETEDEVEIEVEIEDGIAEIKIEIEDKETRFEILWTDKLNTIEEIALRTDLTVEQISSLISFEFEDDDEQVDMKKNQEKVPTWIKNDAKEWSKGNVDDDIFVSGIKHLIKEKVVSIPDLPSQASEKARPNFVDDTKDPQHYIDRYNNEPTYKEWFDENYSDYTIHEAAGVTKPIPGWIKSTAGWWTEGMITEERFIKGMEYLIEKKILSVN